MELTKEAAEQAEHTTWQELARFLGTGILGVHGSVTNLREKLARDQAKALAASGSVLTQSAVMRGQEALQGVFDVLDKNRDGVVTREEFHQAYARATAATTATSTAAVVARSPPPRRGDVPLTPTQKTMAHKYAEQYVAQRPTGAYHSASRSPPRTYGYEAGLSTSGREPPKPMPKEAWGETSRGTGVVGQESLSLRDERERLDRRAAAGLISQGSGRGSAIAGHARMGAEGHIGTAVSRNAEACTAAAAAIPVSPSTASVLEAARAMVKRAERRPSV